MYVCGFSINSFRFLGKKCWKRKKCKGRSKWKLMYFSSPCLEQNIVDQRINSCANKLSMWSITCKTTRTNFNKNCNHNKVFIRCLKNHFLFYFENSVCKLYLFHSITNAKTLAYVISWFPAHALFFPRRDCVLPAYYHHTHNSLPYFLSHASWHLQLSISCLRPW